MNYDLQITIILSLLWVISLVLLIGSAYNFIKAMQSIAFGRDLSVKANPLSFLISSNFTETGNFYRKRFLKLFSIAVICVVISFFIGIYFDQ